MMKTKWLIDANAFIQHFEECKRKAAILPLGLREILFKLYSEVIEEIKKQPAVDALEVVRCKDCRWAREKDHREPTDTPKELICQCFMHHYIPAPWGARMAVSEDDFCSYGERKDDV